MGFVTLTLDTSAVGYTDDQIVAKVNAASAQITRSEAVESAALVAGAAKANLDAMSDATRAYVKTNPGAGETKIISIQRNSSNQMKAVVIS